MCVYTHICAHVYVNVEIVFAVVPPTLLLPLDLASVRGRSD